MRYSCYPFKILGSNTRKINRFSSVFLFHKALLNVESIFDIATVEGGTNGFQEVRAEYSGITKSALAFIILSNREHFMKCRR